MTSLLDALRGMDGGQAFFVLLGLLGLCGLGLPMPEDIILITAGYLASLGKFGLFQAIVAGIVGVLAGDAVLFFLGHHYGRALLRAPWVVRWFTEPRLEAARQHIQAHGRFICFIARFLPGLRSPIYLVAGSMGIPPRTYITQDGLAALISVPFWVIFGYAFGERIEQALRAARSVQIGLLVVVALVVVWQVVRYIRYLRRAPTVVDVP